MTDSVVLDYRIGSTTAASPAMITGSVTSPLTDVSLSGSVAGIGVGDYIALNGQTKKVVSYLWSDSDNKVVVSSGFSGSFSGAALSYYDLTLLSDLTVPVSFPKSTFVPYTRPLPLGDATVRGGGWKKATWRWTIMRQSQRDQLRSFCTGASAEVLLRTAQIDNSDAFVTYRGVMVWPQEETRDAWRRTDFVLTFQALEVWP